MTRFNLQRAAALIVAASLVAACGIFAGKLTGFNARMSGGYATATYARDAAGILLDADAITADEAENLNGQADHFRAALDLTRKIHANDPETGEAKLTATLLALDGLRDYLVKLQNDRGLDDAGP